MDVRDHILEMAKKAKSAGRVLAAASPAAKEEALRNLAALLESEEHDILAANAKDLEAADAKGMDGPRRDRLALTPQVMAEMAQACRDIAAMDDPVGAIETMWQRPNGLQVGRMRIPLGVVAMIYESRPNVTVDASILCLKAGNAVFLRGGSEALHSNLALAGRIGRAMQQAGLPAEAVQVVDTTDRQAISAMCQLDDYIDVIIPRGGEALIRAVVAEARMPVLKHYEGVCHCYVDAGADLQAACNIAYNGKVQRPAVCNALEGLLVHASEAAGFLPMVADKLGKAGVVFKACPESLPLLGATAEPMSEGDPGTEFHGLTLVVKVVQNQDEAQDFIAQHGSNHTEVICTNNHANAMRFLREVDASMVGVNASTRFNDGGQLGLGAEIGISTSKLHSYGPMGVTELTTTKFVALGQNQVRE